MAKSRRSDSSLATLSATRKRCSACTNEATARPRSLSCFNRVSPVLSGGTSTSSAVSNSDVSLTSVRWSNGIKSSSVAWNSAKPGAFSALNARLLWVISSNKRRAGFCLSTKKRGSSRAMRSSAGSNWCRMDFTGCSNLGSRAMPLSISNTTSLANACKGLAGSSAAVGMLGVADGPGGAAPVRLFRASGGGK